MPNLENTVTLNFMTTEKMSNLQNVSRRFVLVLHCLSLEQHFGTVTVKCPLQPKWWPICKILSDASESSLYLVLWTSSWERHFGTLTANWLLNLITTQKMATLQVTIRHLQIIVFSLSDCGYQKSDILKLLRWNLHLPHHNRVTTGVRVGGRILSRNEIFSDG